MLNGTFRQQFIFKLDQFLNIYAHTEKIQGALLGPLHMSPVNRAEFCLGIIP